ncbi:MAG: hypothetical protein CFE34_04435 [Rhodobacteraceae bacterium PARR1]|nr:MAG: hypothetical protein CFE34_04435 [Rhodobacteraceae bacterium PARR1]
MDGGVMFLAPGIGIALFSDRIAVGKWQQSDEELQRMIRLVDSAIGVKLPVDDMRQTIGNAKALLEGKNEAVPKEVERGRHASDAAHREASESLEADASWLAAVSEEDANDYDP